MSYMYTLFRIIAWNDPIKRVSNHWNFRCIVYKKRYRGPFPRKRPINRISGTTESDKAKYICSRDIHICDTCIFLMIMKINNFRGDLTDISANTHHWLTRTPWDLTASTTAVKKKPASSGSKDSGFTWGRAGLTICRKLWGIQSSRVGYVRGGAASAAGATPALILL